MPNPVIGKVVWFSCRATPGCEGKSARIELFWNLATGGRATRYVCLKCGQPFHIMH